RLLATFLDLVRIDSPSGEEDAIAAELTHRLEALGATVRRDAYGNVIAGIGEGGEPFLLGSHMDTVEPGRGVKPVVDGGVIRSDGSTVLGGDAKSGVTAILEGMAAVKASGAPLPALEIVFTRREESGLEGAANLDYSMLTAKRGAEFDGEGAVSNVTIEAPGRISAELHFKGRGAHAGAWPERGISAIAMAARFVAGFPQGRIDGDTTANIGLISGGTAVNAVSADAAVSAEARSRDPSKLEKVRQQILTLVEDVRAAFPEGRVEYELREEFGGYKIAQEHPVVLAVTQAMRGAGFEPNLIASGGATDANVYALHGIEVVVVGLGGDDFHTVRESISVAALNDAARFCEALIASLRQG
ncbi:MAG TPA: M20/M25/M40 family metallo-hydrolase, partial [Dehalococcoidia bacterium]